jgi:hypothetical protein
MAHKIGSYKGNATISLNPDSRFPFTFGVAKAKLILDNLDAIRKFVEGEERLMSDEPKRRGRCEDAPCCGCCP